MLLKVNVYGLDGKVKGNINLPSVFESVYRKDLINKVVTSSQSARKQPQGRNIMAGKRTSAESWGTGRARARVPRVKGSGTRIANSGAFVSMTVGGHLAHPPRAWKNLNKKVNVKEKKAALNSAIAASINKTLLHQRGHQIEELDSPILILDDKIQTVKTTQVLINILEINGLKKELERGRIKKIRSGKGKKRGRKYKRAKGPLMVVENFGIYHAARNIPGIDVTSLRNLCVEDLAPGGQAGRLVIWSESSINALNQRK
ncbi:MAG: 50S ribosomal protein L4 [Candidatus Hodarchaeota archaeon]